MDKQRRTRAVIVAVAALVFLNIWRWWPSTPTKTGEERKPSETFHLEDFEVRGVASEAAEPYRRDIFHPRRPVAKVVVKAVPVAAPEPPAKSPDELAREAAQAALAQIRCVGISIRQETVHAYLLNGEDGLLVSVGEKVGGRFVVEKIMTDRVILRDPNTGIGGQLDLSGK